LENLIDKHLSLSPNYDRAYKKACGRLKPLTTARRNLTTETVELYITLYKMMILPILTQCDNKNNLYSHAVKQMCHPGTTSCVELINTQIRSLMIKCINKETGHEVFDN